MPYRASDNLSFGQSWNTAEDFDGVSLANWAGALPGVRLASSIEIPYAVPGGAEVNQQTSPLFGRTSPPPSAGT